MLLSKTKRLASKRNLCRVSRLLLCAVVICLALETAAAVAEYSALDGSDELIVQTGARAATMPTEVYSFNSHTYAVIRDAMTWHAAKAYCEELDGHLVTVTSAEENRFITSLAIDLTEPWFHMGATDEVVEGDWRWVTGEEWGYTNWDNLPGGPENREPNNGNGTIPQNYLALQVNINDSSMNAVGSWDDSWGNEDSTAFICEWDYDKSKCYTIQVINEKGEPLRDAEVKFDGKTKKTNENGIARFDIFTIGTPIITVKLDGYISWSNADSNWEKNANKYDTIKLFPTSSNTLTLSSVLYSNIEDTPPYCDLLTSTKRLSLGNDAALMGDLDFGDFYIQCEPLIKGYISTYEIYQGDTLIASSNDGSFKLNVDKFNEGKTCSVRTYSSTGKRLDTRINLEFAKEAFNEDTEFSFGGGKMSFKVSDDVPFIGGSNFDFDLPIKSKLTYTVYESKVLIGVNIASSSDKSDREQIREAIELISDVKRSLGTELGKLSKYQKWKFNSLIKDRKPVKLFKNGEVNLIGYIEGDLGAEKYSGELILQGSIDAVGIDYTTWVAVLPVTVQAKLSLDGSIGGEINYDVKTSTLDGDVSFKPSAELAAFGGAGISKFVGVGVYGSAKLDFDIGILPQHTLNSIDLTGELGLKAYIGFFKYERPFAYNTWHLYTANNVVSKSAMMEGIGINGGLFDASEYKTVDLSYLNREIDNMGSASIRQTTKEITANMGVESTPLIQNTYRNARPVMVSANGAIYTAFVRADSNTGKIYTVLSKYYNHEWTSVERVDADAVLDDAPCMCVDQSGQIWLAYARTVAEPDGASLLDYAQKQQIVVGTVNPDTLAFTRRASFDGEGYAHMQQLKVIAGQPVLVWADTGVTDDNSVLWSSNSRICYSALNGEQNVEELIKLDNVMSDFVVGEIDGMNAVAFVIDQDNDYNTSDDRNLYMKRNGVTTLLAENCSGKVCHGVLPGTSNAAFIWNNDGRLVTSEGLSADMPGITSEYKILGDSIVYSAAGETGTELVMLSYKGGRWGAPIILSDGSRYIEDISVVSIDDRLYLMGMYSNVTITQDEVIDEKDLVFTAIYSISDIQLEDAYYDPSGLVEGEETLVTLAVANHGDHAVENVVIMLDGAYLTTVALPLGIGESADIEVSVICPPKLTEMTFSVAEKDWTEFRPSDNERAIKIGYADLSLSYELISVGRVNKLRVFVANLGVEDSGASLLLRDSDGTTLASYEISKLAADGMVCKTYDLNAGYLSSKGRDITASLICPQEELHTYNNALSIHIARASVDLVLPSSLKRIGASAFEGGAFGSVLVPDGALYIGERAFANCDNLQCITIPSTVTEIASNAFENVAHLYIVCSEGSVAEEYAAQHEYTAVTD